MEQFVDLLYLVRSASMRIKMGDAARQKAMKHFKVESMLADYSTLIDGYTGPIPQSF